MGYPGHHVGIQIAGLPSQEGCFTMAVIQDQTGQSAWADVGDSDSAATSNDILYRAAGVDGSRAGGETRGVQASSVGEPAQGAG